MLEFLSQVFDIVFPPKPRTAELQILAKENGLATLKPAPETPHTFIHALFHYKDPLVRALVWEIKYTGNPILVRAVGRLLYEEILSYFEEHAAFASGSWIVVPIPSSRDHLREKGFNQAFEIAKAIVLCDGGSSLRLVPVLQKIRETVAQAKVNRYKRLQNLVGAYAVSDKKAMQGASVIIIDDVTTTGSTFIEARRVLKAAGAKRVIALSVAH